MGNSMHMFYLPLFGYKFDVTLSLFIQWVIIAVVSILSIIATRNLKKIPDRKQTVLEAFVNGINNIVKENMGEECLSFVPYIGTLAIFILIMNLIGLIGFEPPTQDYSVVLGLALISFVVIQFYAVKKEGVLRYFTGYGRPFAFLLPINLLERFMLPVSLSLRLFGNITAGVVIMDTIYSGLGKLSWFAQLGIPVPLHFYFDIFDGAVQMVIFVMLTMINIKVVAEH